MHPTLKKVFDDSLSAFSSERSYSVLLEAKQSYFEQTGQVLEEDDDYEARMSSFNFWYLLEFRHPSWLGTAMEQFIEDQNLEEQLITAIKSIRHSLFEYTGKNIRRHDVLLDVLHDQKVVLSKEYEAPSLVKKDLFLARVVSFEGQNYLLDGLRFLPSEVKSLLAKQAKRVRKSELPDQEPEFLRQVEFLKTKWMRYGHLNAKSIFDFASFGAKAP